MQKRVKFITSGANAEMGAFSAGGFGMVSPEMAKHLIETGAAEYEAAEKKDDKAEKVVKGK